MNRQRKLLRQFKNRIKQSFIDIFDSRLGRPAKKAVITVVGTCITLLGLVLVVLPGPAFLLLPIGLAILALEYPIARKWLRKCQALLSSSAKKADDFFAKKRVRR